MKKQKLIKALEELKELLNRLKIINIEPFLIEIKKIQQENIKDSKILKEVANLLKGIIKKSQTQANSQDFQALQTNIASLQRKLIKQQIDILDDPLYAQEKALTLSLSKFAKPTPDTKEEANTILQNSPAYTYFLKYKKFLEDLEEKYSKQVTNPDLKLILEQQGILDKLCSNKMKNRVAKVEVGVKTLVSDLNNLFDAKRKILIQEYTEIIEFLQEIGFLGRKDAEKRISELNYLQSLPKIEDFLAKSKLKTEVASVSNDLKELDEEYCKTFITFKCPVISNNYLKQELEYRYKQIDLKINEAINEFELVRAITYLSLLVDPESANFKPYLACREKLKDLKEERDAFCKKLETINEPTKWESPKFKATLKFMEIIKTEYQRIIVKYGKDIIPDIDENFNCRRCHHEKPKPQLQTLKDVMMLDIVDVEDRLQAKALENIAKIDPRLVHLRNTYIALKSVNDTYFKDTRVDAHHNYTLRLNDIINNEVAENINELINCTSSKITKALKAAFNVFKIHLGIKTKPPIVGQVRVGEHPYSSFTKPLGSSKTVEAVVNSANQLITTLSKP
ncbi:hypothetical protein ACNVED_11080 [Legionella sp. D16C41]|uniref:hypothetical protein n=1 Tax=Legionella sp. D16C41 TaxID=3402688 RepID=UPI003AF526AB